MNHVGGKRGRKVARAAKRKLYHTRHPERGRKTAQIKEVKGLTSRFAK